MGQGWRRPQAKSWWHLCALQYWQTPHCVLPHTFSAFWLRSSVVSVLISLISNTESTALHDIKLIFGRGPVTRCACTTAWTPVAPVLHCLRERQTHILSLSFRSLSSFMHRPCHYRYVPLSVRQAPPMCRLERSWLPARGDVFISIIPWY